MEGYTGSYKGKKISIQGTGMGIPSTALYLHELICDYHVKTVIRVGTAGALQPSLQLGQIILADQAMTDSGVVQHYHKTVGYPAVNQLLLDQAKATSKELGIAIYEGTVFSTDLFYAETADRYQTYIAQGVLAIEMETSMVYAMAKYFSIKALSLLTISDHILSGEALGAEDREQRTTKMLTLALELALKNEVSNLN